MDAPLKTLELPATQQACSMQRIVLRSREWVTHEVKVSEIAERWAWAWFAAWQKWHDILCHAWSWQKAKRKVARLQMLRCITRARRAAGRKVAARKMEATGNA